MKKSISLLLCLLMALSLSACGKQAVPAVSTDSDGDTPDGGASMVNPWLDYDSPEEAIAAVGFSVTAPEEVEGFDAPVYRVMNGELLEVLYPCADGELRIRKAAGEEDISGDYNTYAETQTVSTPGEDGVVTMKGDGDTVSCATWCSGAYTYSVTARPGVDVLTMTDLVNTVH